MNKILLVNIKPFTFTQTISIFEDGNEVGTMIVPMNKIEEEILILTKNDNISEINIVGPKVYTKGIKKKIEKVELKTYNKNMLNVIVSGKTSQQLKSEYGVATNELIRDYLKKEHNLIGLDITDDDILYVWDDYYFDLCKLIDNYN